MSLRLKTAAAISQKNTDSNTAASGTAHRNTQSFRKLKPITSVRTGRPGSPGTKRVAVHESHPERRRTKA